MASSNKDADAIIITGGIGVGAGFEIDMIYDLKTSDRNGAYISSGITGGFSASPLNVTIAAVRIIPLDDSIKEKLLSSSVRKDILSGLSFGGTMYTGVGGGFMLPVASKYSSRVKVYVMGIGTPQLGGNLSITRNIEDRAEDMRSKIEDASIIID